MEKGNNIQFAQGVNDNMSFSEAFATARQEVGPGGAFVWRGTVYGTYYGYEWKAMSPEEQHEFTSDAVNAYHNQEDNVVTSTKTDEPEPVVNQEEPTVKVIVVEPDYEIDENTHVGIGIVEIDGVEVMFIDIDQDGIYDVAMVDENGNGQIEDNEVYVEESGLSMYDLQALRNAQEASGTTTEEHHVPDGVEVTAVYTNVQITEDGDVGDVGIAKIDGVETVLIDVDQNGTFDVAMGDFNGDGTITENEMVYVNNPELTVQNFQQQIQMQNSTDINGNLVAYNNTPDYTDSQDVAHIDHQLI